MLDDGATPRNPKWIGDDFGEKGAHLRVGLEQPFEYIPGNAP